MRPLNGTLFIPACATRTSVASVIVRVQRGLWRSLRLSGRQLRPTRRPRAFVVIAIFTSAGRSSRNEKVVPRLWRGLRAVRALSGVEAGPTTNTELLSCSAEIAGLPAPED